MGKVTRIIRSFVPPGSSVFDTVLVVVAATLALGLVTVALMTNLALTRYQHFSYLAESFLHGHTYFLRMPIPAWQDVVLYQGHMYWSQGPLPAVLIAPGMAVAEAAGGFFRQGYLQLPLLGLIAWVLYILARRYKLTPQSAAWLTFAYFTSHFMLVALVPTSYHLTHVIATAAVLGALLEYSGRRRWGLIGLLVGCAFLSRPPAGLAFAFFVLQVLRQLPRRDWWKGLTWLVAPCLVCVIFSAWYNLARFGSPFDAGLGKQVSVWPAVAAAREYGVFGLTHIPGNLYYLVLSMPQPVFRDTVSHVLKFPYVAPDPWGMSLLVTSPYLLYLLRRRRLSVTEQDLIITAALVALPILMFHGVGYQQFGYRYALDFFPLLFLALMYVWAQKNSELSRGAKLVVLGSAAVNLYFLLALYATRVV
jgi:hypothetical protein